MPIQVSDESFRGVTNFVVTANSKSFTAAAEKLGITKSAVGKSIALLEERLGTRLFHRSTRKLSLTGDGKAYLESCQAALEILGAAENTLCHRQSTPSGIVRVEMPTSFGRNLFMPILVELANQCPEIKLVLTFHDRLIDPIEEGVDLVLRLGELESTDELIARRIGSQQLLCCATPQYLKKHGTPQKPDDLKKHSCIMGYRKGSPLSWRLKLKSNDLIKFAPCESHQIGDGDALLNACLGHMGICQLPDQMISKYIDNKELIPILTEYSPPRTELHVLWPRTKHLLPKVRLIVDKLISKSEQEFFGPLL